VGVGVGAGWGPNPYTLTPNPNRRRHAEGGNYLSDNESIAALAGLNFGASRSVTL
jgi:hypothetical protein